MKCFLFSIILLLSTHLTITAETGRYRLSWPDRAAPATRARPQGTDAATWRRAIDDRDHRQARGL
mgnify:CR=1 FL=1